MNSHTCMVFDFDGTLADSFRRAHAILNELADRYRFRKVQEHEVEAMRNKTTHEFFAAIGVPLLKIPMLAIHARRELNRHMAEIPFVPGMPETLEQLRQAGCRLGILTSNSVDNVDLFLRVNDQRERFDFIHVSRDVFGKDRRVKALIRKYRLVPEQLIYVGDTDSDVLAAHKAGIRVAAVTWGYQARAQLEQARPTWLIETPLELVTLVHARPGEG